MNNSCTSQYITFTPTVCGSISNGEGTYCSQQGYYCTVGNMVFISASISWSAHSGTGSLLIAGLPFVVRNLMDYPAQGYFNPISIQAPGGAIGTLLEFVANTNQAAPVAIRSNNANVNYSLQNSGTIHCSGWYLY